MGEIKMTDNELWNLKVALSELINVAQEYADMEDLEVREAVKNALDLLGENTDV